MYATTKRVALAGLVLGIGLARAMAAEPSTAMHFRVSTLEGLPVRNAAGEDLGKIKDMVVDLRTGNIRYVALEFGGFLGVGDKLFAIPWTAFKYQPAPDNAHLVLNVSKERLKQAPGFDKSHWPNMADPRWNSDVDTYYQSTSTR